MGSPAHGPDAQDGSGAQPHSGAGEPSPAHSGEKPLTSSRPELFVGAAFLGGLVAAKVIRMVRR
jgi:hypothetical protein